MNDNLDKLTMRKRMIKVERFIVRLTDEELVWFIEQAGNELEQRAWKYSEELEHSNVSN